MTIEDDSKVQGKANEEGTGDDEEDALRARECLALCASAEREKKLVGMFLASKMLKNETNEETFENVANALGSSFLDQLVRPRARTEANAEDVAMSATLGLSVIRALCRSEKFARSATVKFWFDSFVDAGKKKGPYEGLSDDAAADALTCAYAHMVAKGRHHEKETRRENVLVYSAFEAAIEALVRSKGAEPVASAAVGIIDLTFAATEGSSATARAAASCVPALCSILHHSVGEEVQLCALSMLYNIFMDGFLCGFDAPTWMSAAPTEKADAKWQHDCLSGLWIILSSRTSRDIRFTAMSLVSLVATRSGPRWITAENLLPPAVVVAGAVSGGAQKKVPSFLTLVTQLTRVELSVAMHALLNDAHQDELSEEKKQDALNVAQTSLALFEILVEAVSVIAELVDDEAFELTDAMGRISATELTKSMETLEDIFRTMLSVIEDAEDRALLDPFFILGVLRCLGCHLAENQLLERRRMERLMPYLFSDFINEWTHAAVNSRGGALDESEARQMCEESLVRVFASYFNLLADEPAGAETCIESGWFKLTCEVIVKRFHSENEMGAMFVDMTAPMIRQLVEKIASFDAELSIDVKKQYMDAIASASSALNFNASVDDAETKNEVDLVRLFGRVTMDESTDVCDAFAAFAKRLGE